MKKYRYPPQVIGQALVIIMKMKELGARESDLKEIGEGFVLILYSE